MRSALLLVLCASCKVLVGAALGCAAGALVAGPPGALAGAIGGGAGAASASAAAALEVATRPPTPASVSGVLVGLIAGGALVAWCLVRYGASKRYRGAIHAACRQLWRAEGGLHSLEHER